MNSSHFLAYPQDPPHPLPGPHPSLPSPGGTGDESTERPELFHHPQSPDVDGHPGTGEYQGSQEPSKWGRRVVSVSWGYLSQGPTQPPGLTGQTLGPRLSLPPATPESHWGPRVGASLTTGSEGKNILAIRAWGQEVSSPLHCNQAKDIPAGGAIVPTLGTLGLGSALGHVTWPLCASVSSSAALLPLILAWQAREAYVSTRPPGHQPGLTHTLCPAELSKPEVQQPVSDEPDEPDASESEVGSQPHTC